MEKALAWHRETGDALEMIAGLRDDGPANLHNVRKVEGTLFAILST